MEVFLMNTIDDLKIKEAKSKIKTRKQGNSQSLTVPYEFHVPAGMVVQPVLMKTGIYYEFVNEEDPFFNFEADILNEILADTSIPREKIGEVFSARKAAMPKQVKTYTAEAMSTAKVMTEEEMGKAIGL
jgi:hypothetical protein